MAIAGALTCFGLGASVYSEKTERYTARLISAISEAGTDVVFQRCSNEEEYGRYSHSVDEEGFFITDVLTVCTNKTDMTNKQFVWETLAHEATHVAQACDGIGVSGVAAKELTRGVSDRYSIDEIKEYYDEEDWDMEFEAFYMEAAPEADVIDMVTTACADNVGGSEITPKD